MGKKRELFKYLTAEKFEDPQLLSLVEVKRLLVDLFVEVGGFERAVLREQLRVLEAIDKLWKATVSNTRDITKYFKVRTAELKAENKMVRMIQKRVKELEKAAALTPDYVQ